RDAAALDRAWAVKQRARAVVLANRKAQFQRHLNSPGAEAECPSTIPQLHIRSVDGFTLRGNSSLSQNIHRGSKAEANPMKLPPFEYACPSSLSEAVALLAAHNGEAK